MIAIVWRYRVSASSADAFERAYGPRGDWARLFARAQGYIGTELLRIDGGDTYLTIDRWAGRSEFDDAKRMLHDDYDALDRRCEAYTLEETSLGVFALLD